MLHILANFRNNATCFMTHYHRIFDYKVPNPTPDKVVDIRPTYSNARHP
jgi:hypothetical protein